MPVDRRAELEALLQLMPPDPRIQAMEAMAAGRRRDISNDSITQMLDPQNQVTDMLTRRPLNVPIGDRNERAYMGPWYEGDEEFLKLDRESRKIPNTPGRTDPDYKYRNES